MPLTKDTLERMKQQNARSANERLMREKQAAERTDQAATRDTILDAFGMLIKYLDGRVSKTYVMNQLESIDTPDVLKVVEAVEGLHETLKTHENTDLGEITEVMKALLDEAKQLPKDHADIVIPSPIDYQERFKALESKLDTLTAALEQKELVVPAPTVTVTPAEVQIPATDLTPVKEAIKGLKTKQPDIKGGAMQTQNISGLITEKYDSFKIEYVENVFGEDEDAEKLVDRVIYYDGKTKVATLAFSYDGEDLVGVKRS